eukprot:GILK01012257.1.p1 GENE.GILK01012257.1~~GILK01012257.1.p1  ORF type:complete len:138 (-),score=24.88 GILK01012257.1:321-734(-)
MLALEEISELASSACPGVVMDRDCLKSVQNATDVFAQRLVAKIVELKTGDSSLPPKHKGVYPQDVLDALREVDDRGLLCQVVQDMNFRSSSSTSDSHVDFCAPFLEVDATRSVDHEGSMVTESGEEKEPMHPFFLQR